jgi:hypothetical protein
MSRFALKTWKLPVGAVAAAEDLVDPASSSSEPSSRACGPIVFSVRRINAATGSRFRLPVWRSMTGALRPYRAASHLFSLVRMRWNDGSSSPRSTSSA